MFPSSRIKFRHSCCSHGRTHSQQWALVRSRHQHHRPLASLLSQRVLHKLSHLATAFPHQPHHCKISRCIARHHSNQRALTYPRTAKDPNSLPTSYCQHSIQHPQPRLQRFFDRRSLHRMRNHSIQRPHLRHPRRRQLIQRRAQCIQNSPFHLFAHRNLRRHPHRQQRIAITNPLRRLQRHRRHMPAAKPNHLSSVPQPVPIDNLAAFSHRAKRSFRFDRLPIRLHHTSAPPPSRLGRQLGKVSSQTCPLCRFPHLGHHAGL